MEPISEKSVDDVLDTQLRDLTSVQTALGEYIKRHPGDEHAPKWRDRIDTLAKQIESIEEPGNMSINDFIDLDGTVRSTVVSTFGLIAEKDPSLMTELLISDSGAKTGKE